MSPPPPSCPSSPAVAQAPRPLLTSPWVLGVLGLLCTFTAIGLGRFSFTPVMPMLIAEGIGSAVDVTRGTAWMMGGYTLGALFAARAGRIWGAQAVVRLALAGIMLSLGAAFFPWPLEVHILLRALCGLFGAFAMVLGPSLILRCAPADGRARVAGLTYTGIGVGTLISGALVPVAETVSIASALLCGLALVAVIASIWLPKPASAPAVIPSAEPSVPAKSHQWTWPVAAVTVAYSLDAFAYIPHTTLWGTFVAQELGLGIDLAGHHWILFGLGAMSGPLILARVSLWLGIRRTLILMLCAKAAMVALPAFSTQPWVLAVSVTVVGAFCPGLVALVSARLAELGIDALPARWGMATLIFAIVQAIGGWIHASLYAHFHSYLPLFPLAGAALLAAAMILALVQGREE